VANYRTGLLLRIDPAKSSLRSLPTGRSGFPTRLIDTIFRVDPETDELVDSFPGADGAFQARRAFGSMWVTSYAGSDVWPFQTGK